MHILFKPLLELQEWKVCKGLFFWSFTHCITHTQDENISDDVLTLTREQSNRYVYLCDLLYNFIQQHHFRSNFYVLSSNNILSRVATLLRAKDKHLRHGASSVVRSRESCISLIKIPFGTWTASFRIFRLLLKQNNTHIHGLVMKHDVIKPILDLTLQESRRDNLLSCSCQEYFESMRRVSQFPGDAGANTDSFVPLTGQHERIDQVLHDKA